jgi:uncharacterized protein
MQTAESLDWLLDQFANGTPHVSAAVLASVDGMTKARSSGFTSGQADSYGAVLSGIVSLTEGAATQFGAKNPWLKLVQVEVSGLWLFALRAGSNSLLGVLAGEGCDVGVVGHEMSRLVKAVPDDLGTPTREAG